MWKIISKRFVKQIFSCLIVRRWAGRFFFVESLIAKCRCILNLKVMKSKEKRKRSMVLVNERLNFFPLRSKTFKIYLKKVFATVFSLTRSDSFPLICICFIIICSVSNKSLVKIKVFFSSTNGHKTTNTY